MSWIRGRDLDIRVSSSLLRRRWFDALIVVAAITGVIEIVIGRDDADAPDLPLALALPIEAALTWCFSPGTASPSLRLQACWSPARRSRSSTAD